MAQPSARADARQASADPAASLLVGIQPLRLLLRYVEPHRKYAVRTALLGSVGFLLSFLYPWVIGEVVDLLGARGTDRLARGSQLWALVWLAALSSVVHAFVIYGRGHYNTLLGSCIVTDLRRDLFDHLQRLSVRFYAQQQIGTVLARVVHDVREATSLCAASPSSTSPSSRASPPCAVFFVCSRSSQASWSDRLRTWCPPRKGAFASRT